MGDAAQFLFGARERHAVQLTLLDRVGQAVAHVVAAVGAAHDAAIGQEVGALRAPVVVRDGRIDVQAGAGGADQAELARAGQVGADHLGQGATVGIVHGEIGDGHRVLWRRCRKCRRAVARGPAGRPAGWRTPAAAPVRTFARTQGGALRLWAGVMISNLPSITCCTHRRYRFVAAIRRFREGVAAAYAGFDRAVERRDARRAGNRNCGDLAVRSMQLYLVFGRGVLRAAAGRRRISHARLHAGTDFGAIARVAAAGSAGLVAVGGAAGMPAAPSASLRKASLRALSAAAFWRPLPWLLGGGLLGGDLFSRGLFGGRLLGSSLFGGGLWRRLPWPSSRRRPFGCGLFRSGLVGGSLVSGLAFLFQALLFLQLGLLALFLQARLFLAASAASRAFSSSSRFFWLAAARSQGRLPTWAAGPGFGRRRGGSGCFCGSGSGCGLG